MGFSVEGIRDFEKFTEGMDALGSSEEEEEDEEEESGMEEGDGAEDSEGESGEDTAQDGASEDDGVVMTFSSARVSEEVEKGRAVKNQIGVYMARGLLVFPASSAFDLPSVCLFLALCPPRCPCS